MATRGFPQWGKCALLWLVLFKTKYWPGYHDTTKYSCQLTCNSLSDDRQKKQITTQTTVKWVHEWVSDCFSAKVAYFHQYHDQNKLRPFGFIAPKSLNFLAFQSFYFERTDEGYSRNVSCALNLIYTFLLHSIRWDGIDVRFVLYQHAYSDLHSASSLKQQSASEYMAPLRHIILIPCQPVFALLNAACLAEEQQIPLL